MKVVLRVRKKADFREKATQTENTSDTLAIYEEETRCKQNSDFCDDIEALETSMDDVSDSNEVKYKLFLPYDGNWGAMTSNGSFNGMVGMVQSHWMDFAMATITITQIRETVIDFTHAFYEEPTAILIPPAREQNNFLAFLQPFTWQVWTLILISILVVGPLTGLLVNSVDLPVLYPHRQESSARPLVRYVWDSAFCLTSQGNNMRQSEPARILSAFWWVYSITIIYTYNGTLIAFLTIPSLTNLINSLDELANQRDVLWTYRSNSAHETLFANAPAPGTYNKIGKLLAERPDLLVRTDQDGVEAVLGGHTAFIKEKSWLDFAMEADYLNTKECRLSLVNHYFFSAGYGWALQSESPFLRLFNAEWDIWLLCSGQESLKSMKMLVTEDLRLSSWARMSSRKAVCGRGGIYIAKVPSVNTGREVLIGPVGDRAFTQQTGHWSNGNGSTSPNEAGVGIFPIALTKAVFHCDGH
ncbi:probable glutamate receptor [Penaeus indicus]|uniref:probable glutamate receptor n=1 Tax=Penaeus indicus TaxID=29960 RepID=UPI00300D05AA